MSDNKHFPPMPPTTRDKGAIKQGYTPIVAKTACCGLPLVNAIDKDILLVDPHTGVQHSFVPAVGFKIEVVDASIKRSPLAPKPPYYKTVTFTRFTEHYKYLDDVVKVRYELPPEGALQSNEIYVVHWDTYQEMLAAYNTEGQQFPTVIAVPTGPVLDAAGSAYAYEGLELHWPAQLVQPIRTIEEMEREAQPQLFEA